ncbi:hypothetical protein AB833_31515 [Chromatiales bacterium (ex Bugula neritina AB1)]|nr:hypothetical protein AB833_31515 [Chromatiales bacterium (ex Bugula neritina AB1)]
MAQQTPSQRYLPVRSNPYQQTQQPQTQQPNTQPQNGYAYPARNPQIVDAKRLPSNRLPSPYTQKTTAPAPAPSIPDQSQYYPERVNRGMVQLTSYQEPVVPEILSGVQNKPTSSGKTMGEYAKSLGLETTTMESGVAKPTGVLPGSTKRAGATMKANQFPTKVPVNSVPVVKKFDTGTAPNVAPAARLSAIDSLTNRARSKATQVASQRMDNELRASQAGGVLPVQASGTKVSATQFMADVNEKRKSATQDTTKSAFPVMPASNLSPAKRPVASNSMTATQMPTSEPTKLVATQGSQPKSQAMQLATKSNIQPVQGIQEIVPNQGINQKLAKDAVVQLSAPSISVVTKGPEIIGINKPSQFKVVVRNNSVIDAERILVGIDLPEWVDLRNVTQTGGGKELTDGRQQARLVWSVDKVEGNSEQVMTITAVPRKAEVFDLGVEWTLVPRTGKTNIKVTEPKLEMSISGPKEVLYGEVAIYHVAVRNPGTGTAERVSVMLPEALGGERQTLGDIPAGKDVNFQIELLARTAGDLNLTTRATADGNLKTSAERALIVRRAKLQVGMNGPRIRYSGDTAKYSVTVTNVGDATANELMAAVALPPGVKYLSGIEGVKLIEGGMRWPVGSLAPGQSRSYAMHCLLDTAGEIQLEVGTQGKGELAAAGAFKTTVDTIADLVLTVTDLKGPLPTGKEVPYTIKVRNRGTKAAQNVSLAMQFSPGVEPQSAKGLTHELKKGQVQFTAIPQIDPGQEITLQVNAMAMTSGTHIFRAQLNSKQTDVHEIAEGTTRFYGDPVQPPAVSTAEGNSFETGIK